MLTSRLDNVAFTASVPQCFPISLTIPKPYSADSASTLAEVMKGTASVTAVSNPNDLSRNGISLSILEGIAII